MKSLKISFIIVALLFLLALPQVSAWGWDNKITYADKDMKVTFENARGLPFIGSKLGEVKLASHRNVTEVIKVNVGKDKTVMYYDFKKWELYKNGLGEVIFTDERTGEEIEKDYYFAKPIYETKNYPVYNPRCEDGTTGEECKKLIKNETETHLIGWERLENNDIPKEEITIGLVTDVEEGDYIDAQWIIAGRKVSKHASWIAGSLLDGLVSAWKMDSTGTAIDGSGVNDCTKAGDVVDNNVTAFFGTSYSFDGNTDGLDCGNDQSSNMTDAFTVCSIAYPSNVAGGNKRIINKHWTSSHISPFFSYYMATVGDLRFGAAVEGQVKEFTAGAVVINQPNWVCGTFNGTTLVAYINGSEVGNLAAVGRVYYGGQRNLYIGSNEHNTEDFEGSIDETFLWNRTLTAAEISDWYNDGDGLEFITDNPNVTINNPINDTFTTATTEFNITCISDLGIESANYTINDGVDNITLINNGGDEWTDINTTMAQGGYKARFSCYDPDGGVNNSESVDFTIAFAPIVTITSPDTGSNFTKTDIEINNTITFQIPQVCKYSDDGGLTNNSLVCGQNISYIASQGQTNFTIFANSSNGNEGSDTIWLFVDSVPNDITLSSPIGNISYHISGNNLTLNWSISGNSGACWYTNDSGLVNYTLTCLDLNLSFLANVFDSTTITFYNNDTFGNENFSTTTWGYNVFENSQNFNTTAYETDTENFFLNMSSSGSEAVTASLDYNGTAYTGVKSGDNTNMLFSYALDVPLGIGNKSFFWTVSDGGTNVDTTRYNQTVNPMLLDYCNTSLITPFINFTFIDEETLLSLNSTMEVTNWRYWLGNGDVYKELSYTNTSENPSYGFCFTPAFDTFSSTSTSFRYSASGYQQRIHTRGIDLSNTTTNQLLYLLSNADGISVRIIAQDTFGAPISGVRVVVEREFSGSWTTIGVDDTDDSGSATFWLNPDYDHRFTLSKLGLATQVLIIKPTDPPYPISMGGGANASAEIYNSVSEGIKYVIIPTPGSILNKTTDYTFQFNTQSNESNLVLSLFNITDHFGNLLGSVNGTIGAGNDLSIVINTGSNKSIKSYYYIDTGSGLSQITYNQYMVIDVNATKMSVIEIIKSTNIDNEDLEDQFGYFFFFFLILFILVAGLTKFTGADLVAPGTVLIVIGLGTLALSLGNFFTITFTSNSFINQFGISAVAWGIIGGYIVGQFNRS